MTGKRLTKRQRQRLADPATYAAMDAALAAARARFDPMMEAITAEVLGLLNARRERALTQAETVRLMALQARFDGLSMEQKCFAEADLAERLGPRDGSETVDA
jgi:hypothetical protein